jgi:transcription-repair coupling factor (superfamily II helicase)
MSVKVLLNAFINSPRLFQLADRLSFSQTQKIYLENLRGSSPEFFSAAMFEHPSCSQFNHLIVLNDAEDAAYFHNTLENLTGALDIFYFPASFKQRKNFSLLNSSHVMLRTEALTKIASQLNASGSVNKKVLVTYPEALFEKVVVSTTLSSNIIFIKNGDTLDTGSLLLKLADFGFERTDFVYEPGQFAIRGGIFDIYSFGNERPYRIELFGNEVDSIRIIDPETQLSERKLLQLSIIPNIETQFVDKEKISLLDFLPGNTIVWMRDEELVYKKLKDCEEELEYFFENKIPDQKIKDNVDQSSQVNFTKGDFISSCDLEKQIERLFLCLLWRRTSKSIFGFHIAIKHAYSAGL